MRKIDNPTVPSVAKTATALVSSLYPLPPSWDVCCCWQRDGQDPHLDRWHLLSHCDSPPHGDCWGLCSAPSLSLQWPELKVALAIPKISSYLSKNSIIFGFHHLIQLKTLMMGRVSLAPVSSGQYIKQGSHLDTAGPQPLSVKSLHRRTVHRISTEPAIENFQFKIDSIHFFLSCHSRFSSFFQAWKKFNESLFKSHSPHLIPEATQIKV